MFHIWENVVFLKMDSLLYSETLKREVSRQKPSPNIPREAEKKPSIFLSILFEGRVPQLASELHFYFSIISRVTN